MPICPFKMIYDNNIILSMVVGYWIVENFKRTGALFYGYFDGCPVSYVPVGPTSLPAMIIVSFANGRLQDQ